MNLTPLDWTVLIFITEQIWFGLIFWKVHRVARKLGPDGIQEFADLMLQALANSAMRVPAMLLNAVKNARGRAEQAVAEAQAPKEESE